MATAKLGFAKVTEAPPTGVKPKLEEMTLLVAKSTVKEPDKYPSGVPVLGGGEESEVTVYSGSLLKL
ncbi:hypothetical protein DSM21852_32970 [Methylocystis bryophila]|uniref:Uncharacterized protein n=1 Tax=Methylocystis bryophila TaxID=655015 RepID=A0A1W6MR85_9HYPH|nr:hypothetical protein B1812_02350 [Methylocystis bryophila]BDV40044.1 hypothetical protein DSM21852_32970 [Methylocystis bryophila]